MEVVFRFTDSSCSCSLDAGPLDGKEDRVLVLSCFQLPTCLFNRYLGVSKKSDQPNPIYPVHPGKLHPLSRHFAYIFNDFLLLSSTTSWTTENNQRLPCAGNTHRYTERECFKTEKGHVMSEF